MKGIDDFVIVNKCNNFLTDAFGIDITVVYRDQINKQY